MSLASFVVIIKVDHFVTATLVDIVAVAKSLLSSTSSPLWLLLG